MRPASALKLAALTTLLAAFTHAQDRPPPPRAGDRPRGEVARPEPPQDETRAGAPREEPPPRGLERRPQPRMGPPMRFEATVYRVQIAPDRVLELDGATLAAQAGSPADLHKSLSAIGATRVLAHADQVLTLEDRTRISTVSDAPYVSAAGAGQGAKTQAAISRQDTGVSFDINGIPAIEDQAARVIARIEINDVTESGISVGEDHKAPIFRKATQNYSAPPKDGKPIVLVNLDGAAAGESGTVAYVTRLVFRRVDAAH